MILELRDDFRRAWPQPFEAVQQVEGEIFRDKEGRTTQRFIFEDKPYFLKLHRGVGWWEIFKNLFQFRLPVVGAKNEWRAIELLHCIGIGTMNCVGYGKRGLNPARQLSFLLTEELSAVESLEDYCEKWPQQPPGFAARRILIEAVAGLARQMHAHGMNHRDFYLCHILLADDWDEEGTPSLFLIDLHRAQLRAEVPPRWLVKDLGSLYFSALDIGLGRKDVLRFLKAYTGRPLREVLSDRAFWSKVCRRAATLYQRDFGKQPVLPLG